MLLGQSHPVLTVRLGLVTFLLAPPTCDTAGLRATFGDLRISAR